MPIWIKYKNDLMLCDVLSIGAANDDGTCSLYAYPSCGGVDGFLISVKNLTEQQAKDLMRDIVDIVAAGGRYYEIPERSIP